MAVIVFTNVAGSTITPTFTFTVDTISFVVSGGGASGNFTSTTPESIVMAAGTTVTISTDGVWTNITALDMTDDVVTGDIAQLAVLTGLTSLIMEGTAVSGNISDLAALVSLVTLDLSETSVTADASCLDTQVLMTTCNINDCSWSEAETDLSIVSLVVNDAAGAGGRNCTVDIGGTNAAPSIARIADWNTLLTSGWTITMNPIAPLVFTGIGGVNVTPEFTFGGSAAIDYVVSSGGATGSLATGVEDDIAIADSETITYYLTAGLWTDITEVDMNADTISGSIAQLTGLTGLTSLILNTTSVTGDILNLNGLTSLTVLDLHTSSVTGALSGISALTSLVTFSAHTTSITGAVTDVSTFTSLTSLALHTTALTGNLSDLVLLVSLATLDLSTTSVTADASCLDANILLTTCTLNDCAWTVAEVGLCLTSLLVSELAGGARTPTVDISGTNAVPSTAGFVTWKTLVDASWTVTTTPQTDTLVFTGVDGSTLDPEMTFTGCAISYAVSGGGATGTLTSTAEHAAIAIAAAATITYSLTTGSWIGVTEVDLSGDAVSGNLSQFAPLTNMTSLILSTTSVDADASCLDANILMVTCTISNCAWTETETDLCLASLVVNEAAGSSSRDCTVDISGTNSTPSAAGLVNYYKLVDADWVMTATGIQPRAQYVGPAYTEKSSLTDLTTAYGGWVGQIIDTKDRSNLSLAFDINYKATSFTLTAKLQAWCANGWYDVYKNVNGVLVLDTVTTPTITADVKIVVPYDVSGYDKVRVLALASVITGTPTLRIFTLNEYMQTIKEYKNGELALI